MWLMKVLRSSWRSYWSNKPKWETKLTCPKCIFSFICHISLCLYLFLSVSQWRNEQTILDRQNQQGSTAANTQTKLRRYVFITYLNVVLLCFIIFYYLRTLQLCCIHCLHLMSFRTSVCRMSSKDKINVQDQSKEKGVSGSLEFTEERESSFGKPATLWSVWLELLHAM